MSEFPPYTKEADLCADFITWARSEGYRCFPETGGFDVLLVDASGFQLGIEAKLRMNMQVIEQALRGATGLYYRDQGPDWRGVLVPDDKRMAEPLILLGLSVFEPMDYLERNGVRQFKEHRDYGLQRFDWNPAERLQLPPVEFNAPAGVPCPSGMTPWKLAALRLIALLELRGYLTRADFRDLKLSPTLWMTPSKPGAETWLVPGAERGQWVRGSLPAFHEATPTVYAAILEEVRLEQI